MLHFGCSLFFGLSALLGGHHVDIARLKGHFLAPAFGALHFQPFVLGDGLRAIGDSASRHQVAEATWP